MAQDDYFVIVYKILEYLYQCMKAGKRPMPEDLAPQCQMYSIPITYRDQLYDRQKMPYSITAASQGKTNMYLRQADTAKNRALALARKCGFNYVLYAGKWKEYDVYIPSYDEHGNIPFGTERILTTSEEDRWATSEETYRIVFKGECPVT